MDAAKIAKRYLFTIQYSIGLNTTPKTKKETLLNPTDSMKEIYLSR
jgi:hypothetical protein